MEVTKTVRHILWDIETTGFSKTNDVILSFAHAIFNKDMTDVEKAGVLYFYKEGQPRSHPEALAVHQLTDEFLMQFENEYTDNLQKMFKLLTRSNSVTYNGDSFDIPFASSFLSINGYGELVINSSIDIMKVWQPVFQRRVKLAFLTDELKVPKEIIEKLQKKWFGQVEGARHHNASYDVTVTALATLEAKRRGMI
jgi:DNA polymerase III alpha subunit (gram-positive type)